MFRAGFKLGHGDLADILLTIWVKIEALLPQRGQCVTRAGSRSGAPFVQQPREDCAVEMAFSLHAGQPVPGDDRERLERLCRYAARPAVATKRLHELPDGRIVYDLRHSWSDGTTRVVFEPLTFLEKLAALVPTPRAHQLTYHGVLAPAAAWRASIVPGPSTSRRKRPCVGGVAQATTTARLWPWTVPNSWPARRSLTTRDSIPAPPTSTNSG